MDGPLANFATDISEILIISSNKGGKLVDFMEYSIYFQDLFHPSQGTQATLTQETKKV